MSTPIASAELIFDEKSKSYCCKGEWSILNLEPLLKQIADLSPQKVNTISGSELSRFDSAGALALLQCMEKLDPQSKHIKLVHFNEEQQALFNLIKKNHGAQYTPLREQHHLLYFIGQETFQKFNQARGFIALIGDLIIKFVNALGHWKRFQWSSILSNIDSTGVHALPIVGLLAFLIGIVLAYQMGLQLQTYGANNFIAYLSGMAIFREFAPLITAIIVAGRTSSAFTAQIGSMKINEEIDALSTMGLSPTELLVMPKVLGLLFVFPLLIFWADIFSVLGAMIMSNWMLNISYYEYLDRLRDSVGLSQLRLGLYKAPAFALLIALVGCFQGFRIQSSADNIGYQTTKSVVQALFLIIITDAVYSIIYSWMDL